MTIRRDSNQDLSSWVNEVGRIKGILEREGVEAAIRFAEQTLMVYKAHLKFRKKSDPKRSFARSRDYRRKFIIAIFAMKDCLQQLSSI